MLNQAVKRNVDQILDDFVFRVNATEETEVVTNPGRFTNLKKRSLRYFLQETIQETIALILPIKHGQDQSDPICSIKLRL